MIHAELALKAPFLDFEFCFGNALAPAAALALVPVVNSCRDHRGAVGRH
jgi:hypothetical protein